MASMFASQLRQIAEQSTHELDLRARRTAHGESLISPRDVAEKQDFDTIFAICQDGFRELCSLEPQLRNYDRTLFSDEAKVQDREQMNKTENEALDTVLGQCLALLGGRALLRPGVQALEWLVRRFQVHIYNVNALLLTFLPYHETPIWQNVLSIIPQEKIVGEWNFIRPYLGTKWNVPRHAVLHAAATNDRLFAILNRYILDTCRNGASHPALMKFWGSVVVEAISSRLDQAQSGRKEVQRQRVEDVLLKVLPVLSDGFEIPGCQSLTLSCYTIAMIVAAKAGLGDDVLDSLLRAVADTIRSDGVDVSTSLLTLAVIVSKKETRILPKSVIVGICNLPNFENVISQMQDMQLSENLLEAAVSGILAQVREKNAATYLPFLERILRFRAKPSRLVSTAVTLKPVLSKILQMDKAGASGSRLRSDLIELLQRLSDEEEFSSVLAEAAALANVPSQAIEALLGMTLQPLPLNIENDEDVTEDTPALSDNQNVVLALANIPARTTSVSSFLTGEQDRLFDQLQECFKLCCRIDTLTQTFATLQLWSTSDDNDSLLISFLVRFSFQPNSVVHRAAALRLLSTVVARQKSLKTFQILPYVLINLADPAQTVRKSAAAVLSSMVRLSDLKSGEDDLDLYTISQMERMKHISGTQLRQVLESTICPELEEFILDSERISETLTSILSTSSSADIKKSARHGFFDLLTSTALVTESYRVKLGLLQMLQGVQKVGSDRKAKVLSQLLEKWTTSDEITAEAVAQKEKLKVSEIDTTLINLIDSLNSDLLPYMLNLRQDGNVINIRPSLIEAVFDRIIVIWKTSKEEHQLETSGKLFDFASSNQLVTSQGAIKVLESVPLSSSILASFLSVSTDAVAELRSGPPPKKRRRTSQSEDRNSLNLFETSIAKLTFALELMENSKPESRPEILANLFETLAIVRQVKSQHRVNAPYLLSLCLSSILAMVDNLQADGKTIDLSRIRPDLVTECIRDSDNPQVTNTALLLASALSSLIPDRMIHDIMPVFTLVDKSMFARDDDHSVLVMNRTIDQIVPALVMSLRKSKKVQNILLSIANLLTSFASAFDHIPHHRKIAFYQRIISRIGAEDFGYVIIAMLAIRNSESSDFPKFLNSLLDNFSVDTQLMTYQHLITLSNDVFSTQPRVAEAVLGIVNSTPTQEKRDIAQTVLRTGQQILRSHALKAQVFRTYRLEIAEAETTRGLLENVFKSTLVTIRDRKGDNDVFEGAKECLQALLDVLSSTELMHILPRILEDIDNTLKPQCLQVLTLKLENSPTKDPRTRVAAMGFLQILSNSLSTSLEPVMRQATLACMDRIIDTYGRKDLDSVISAATAIVENLPSSITVLSGDSDYRNSTVAILTMTTIVETLKEGAVPVIPGLLPRLQATMDACIATRAEQSIPLFNAACTLVSAIFFHVAFMVSEDQLIQLLKLILGSTTTFAGSTDIASGHDDVLRTVARKVEINILLEALRVVHKELLFSEPTKTIDAIQILSQACDKASKSTVVRHAESFSDLFCLYLQARLACHHSAASNETEAMVEQIESSLKSVSVKFIYKLNDTTFRPIFESWVDWASTQGSEEEASVATTLRQTSLFNILQHFFQTLKAIVTSYASFLIKPISTILTEFTSSAEQSSKTAGISRIQETLFASTLSLLRTTAIHDADGFYTTPSHFDPIAEPLIKLLTLATYKSFRPLVSSSITPTIVALASATVDSPSHHHTLSHHITQLRRHGSAHVRLASIKTLHALIDDGAENSDENNFAVGNDWIANTVGVGSGEGEGARGGGGGGAAGEVMIYVNEMLEDDDEDVEREVRRWVQRIRDRVGEDVFEV